MRILVAGGGSLGLQAAQRLGADGHDVTIIELSSARASAIRQLGLATVRGDAAVAATLEAAGALRAQALIACTASDEENLLISFVAKRHFAIHRVVALVNRAENAWLFGESWGVDAAVSPTAALLSMIEQESSP
ncbi:MAG TPA: NAD(P)-binding protein [Acidimicrobiales bacterium]|nr:NAD(P)-binding protein [Acidimicrobiales bacterium]